MNPLERYICSYPSTDQGVSSSDELYAQKETEHGALEGYIAPHLREQFLAGYLQFLREAFPEKQKYQNLPEVIDGLLSPILPREGDNIDVRAYGFGSCFRYMARGGMDDRYWEFSRHVWNEKKQWDPDLDVMVFGAPVNSLFEQFVDVFRIDNIELDEEDPNRIKGSCDYLGFTVVVSFGRISTSEISNMVVEIYDDTYKDTLSERTKRRLFHLDISELTKDPQIIRIEKRVGETFSWGDEVFASLTNRNGHVYYRMDKSEQDAMHRPNDIVTRSTDAVTLAELVLRAIWQGELHPLSDEPVDFRNYPTATTSRSILQLRKALLNIELRKREIPEINLDLLTKQLRDCLDYDPFGTIQYLRAFGLQLLPELEHLNLSPYDWDNVLRSDMLAFEVAPGGPEGRLVSPDRRDWDYVARQHALYKSSGRFDGAERVMDALEELGLFHFQTSLPDDRYKELCSKPPSPDDIEIASSEHEITIPEGHVVGARVGDLIILYPPEKVPGIIEDIAENGRAIVEATKPEIFREEKVVEVDQIIQEYTRGTSVQKMYKVYDRLSQKKHFNYQERQRINRLTRQMNMLVRAYVLLDHYGYLTPRELKRKCFKERGVDENIKDSKNERFFRRLLLALKSLGLVALYEQRRISDPGQIEQIASLVPRKGADINYIDTLYRAMESNAKFKQKIPKDFDLVITFFSRDARVPSVEALASLRTEDFEQIYKRTKRVTKGRTTAQKIEQNAAAATKLFYEFLSSLPKDQV